MHRVTIQGLEECTNNALGQLRTGEMAQLGVTAFSW